MARTMKYGLILAGIYLVIGLIAIVVTQYATQDIADFIAGIMFGLSLPAMGLLSLIMGARNFIVHATTSAFIGIVLISGSIYFLIGALIGWIIDKRKNPHHRKIRKR